MLYNQPKDVFVKKKIKKGKKWPHPKALRPLDGA
jgi:hypothetical protein